MQLFYNSEITTLTKQLTFNKQESKHIIKVLRKTEGDILKITNGKDLIFFTKIISANYKKCTVFIIKNEKKNKDWNYYLHIAIAPTKNIDRFEWFLEKATEIGIDEITPIICQNSERKTIKIERQQKIIQSAMKQSLKYRLPKLNYIKKFSDFINQEFGSNSFIAHCKPTEKKLLKNVAKLNNKTTILIGPEGDFSNEEIKNALSKKIIPISLGKSRLRTETAGLIAVQNINFLHQ